MRARPYNTSQLYVEQDLSRLVFHRDRLAHVFRWLYALRKIQARKSPTVLDVGCADANLMRTLHSNPQAPFKVALYLGVDVKKSALQNAANGAPTWAQFQELDAVTQDLPLGPPPGWDFITCFEMLEHVGRHNVQAVLTRIRAACHPFTEVLVSTPVYDPRIGAAANHMIEGERAELTTDELKAEFRTANFGIVRRFGTFASERDMVPHMEPAERELFDRLKRYYPSNITSVMFAPLHPEQSRNVIWELAPQ